MSLRVENVAVALGGREVLRGIDADFAPGTLTGVIGPNGAGKSTLARSMLALVGYSGRIALDGVEVATMQRAELARRVAYLPQGQTLHWPLAVERLVGLGRLPHLAPLSGMSDSDMAAIERAMARADVLDLRDRTATELSGGERSRVLLARALAVEAPALVADEPLASLDPGHQLDVMELLHAEAHAGGMVIAVLHDLAMAARYCDRLLLLAEGRVVAAGAPFEVMTAENLRDVYGIEARVEDAAGRAAIITFGRASGERRLGAPQRVR